MSADKTGYGPPRSAEPPRRPELPRRFYKSAAAGPHDGAFALFLDQRVVKTPARHVLAVDDAAVAEALAAEWGAQGERIEPATMPLTRIVNAAIDRVGGEMPAVRRGIVDYAGTDLVCYRAESPQSLVETQAAAWDPLLAWARDELGAALVVATGIVHVAQPAKALAAIERALEPYDALRLAAVSTTTTLTGSAVIALALARGRLTADEAWDAALIDEEWQARQWGRDDAAMAARAFRRREMEAAGLILSARP